MEDCLQVNHLNKAENYGADPWREPTYEKGDTVLFSECGRVLPGGSSWNVTYQSHWLSLVKAEYGGLWLLVKHGGGEERVKVRLPHTSATLEAFATLPSHARYAMLYSMYELYSEARTEAKQATTQKIFGAFCDGRLKRKKRDGCWVMNILPKQEEPNP